MRGADDLVELMPGREAAAIQAKPARTENGAEATA
jgi:hypothetical protein